MNILDQREALIANIRGKRVRSLLFYASFAVALVLAVAGAIFFVHRLTAMAVVSCFWAGCLLLLAFLGRKPLCILAEEQLYFLHGDVIQKSPNSRRTHHTLNCTGTVFYSEILSMQYVGGILHYTRYWKNGYLLLIGAGFEIKIYDVERSLINKIRKRKMFSRAPVPQDISIPSPTPQGNAMWQALWTACENGTLEAQLAGLGKITQLDMNSELGTVDLAFLHGRKEVCANIDCDSIYLCVPSTGAQETHSLADCSLDEVYALLRGFAEQHTCR